MNDFFVQISLIAARRLGYSADRFIPHAEGALARSHTAMATARGQPFPTWERRS